MKIKLKRSKVAEKCYNAMSLAAAARLASCGGGGRAMLLRVSSSSVGGGGRGLSTDAEAAEAVENRVKSAHQVT